MQITQRMVILFTIGQSGAKPLRTKKKKKSVTNHIYRVVYYKFLCWLELRVIYRVVHYKFLGWLERYIMDFPYRGLQDKARGFLVVHPFSTRTQTVECLNKNDMNRTYNMQITDETEFVDHTFCCWYLSLMDVWPGYLMLNSNSCKAPMHSCRSETLYPVFCWSAMFWRVIHTSVTQTSTLDM